MQLNNVNKFSKFEKNYRFSNTFWLYQHGVRSALFQRYSHLNKKNLYVRTFPLNKKPQFFINLSSLKQALLSSKWMLSCLHSFFPKRRGKFIYFCLFSWFLDQGFEPTILFDTTQIWQRRIWHRASKETFYINQFFFLIRDLLYFEMESKRKYESKKFSDMVSKMILHFRKLGLTEK